MTELSSEAETGASSQSRPGVLPRLLVRLFFREATVTNHQSLGMGMYRITLEGPALCGVQWTPGDKIQVQMGQALVTRTYTPIRWDAHAGQTEFIAHAHASGPGSEWVRLASRGQTCKVMGPRSSLSTHKAPQADWLLLGDETAIGLGLACQTRHSFLETRNATEAHDLCAALGLPATTYSSQPDDSHLPLLLQDALAHARVRPDTCFLLAGRARSVQWLLKALKGQGIASSRLNTKAYWADGKVGLD